MGIFSFFRKDRQVSERSDSASVAKERLQVLISHDRTDRNGPDYLPQLKEDLIDVIKKYVNVGEEQVLVKLDTQGNRDVLELNITLPDVVGGDVAVPAKTGTVSFSPASKDSDEATANGAAKTTSNLTNDADTSAAETRLADRSSEDKDKGDSGPQQNKKNSGKKKKPGKQKSRKRRR